MHRLIVTGRHFEVYYRQASKAPHILTSWKQNVESSAVAQYSNSTHVNSTIRIEFLRDGAAEFEYKEIAAWEGWGWKIYDSEHEKDERTTKIRYFIWHFLKSVTIFMTESLNSRSRNKLKFNQAPTMFRLDAFINIWGTVLRCKN